MRPRARLTLAILAGAVTYGVVSWIPLGLIPFAGIFGSLIAVGCGIMAGRWVFERTADADASVAALAASGAVLLGAIGFAAGFFGPMLLAPEANQGPMLGIFITGPLGFVLGGAGGLIYGLRRRARSLDPQGFSQ